MRMGNKKLGMTARRASRLLILPLLLMCVGGLCSENTDIERPEDGGPHDAELTIWVELDSHWDMRYYFTDAQAAFQSWRAETLSGDNEEENCRIFKKAVDGKVDLDRSRAWRWKDSWSDLYWKGTTIATGVYIDAMSYPDPMRPPEDVYVMDPDQLLWQLKNEIHSEVQPRLQVLVAKYFDEYDAAQPGSIKYYDFPYNMPPSKDVMFGYTLYVPEMNSKCVGFDGKHPLGVVFHRTIEKWISEMDAWTQANKGCTSSWFTREAFLDKIVSHELSHQIGVYKVHAKQHNVGNCHDPYCVCVMNSVNNDLIIAAPDCWVVGSVLQDKIYSLCMGNEHTGHNRDHCSYEELMSIQAGD